MVDCPGDDGSNRGHEGNARSHPDRVLAVLGNSNKGTETQKLDQNKVINENKGD